jgi:hypothetical protein
MARRPCIMSESGSCRSYDSGHNLHFIHARLLGETPWGWRDGIVTSVRGGEVMVAYLEVDHEIRLWHHSSLATLLVGAPVQVHERYHALGGGFGCVNVVHQRARTRATARRGPVAFLEDRRRGRGPCYRPRPARRPPGSGPRLTVRGSLLARTRW